MQLIGSYTSPYVRKIRILLTEKGLPFSFLEDIPWDADSKAPQYNPLGKVPILIAENGSLWFDSKIIAEYIEALHTSKPLVPSDPLEALHVRQLEALADGITEAGVAIFLEKKRNKEQQSEAWIERQLVKINRCLDVLEAKLDGVEWLHANNFSLADIATGSVLGWLDLRLPGLNWRNQRSNLAAFAERIFNRESFTATHPPDIA